MQQVPSRIPAPPAVSSGNQIPVQIQSLRPNNPLPALPAGPRGSLVFNPYQFAWRQRLRLASFKGAPFYVESQGRSSGRRTVLHQYPKRDIPYAEDMGRDAIHYAITGYLIQAPTDPRSSNPAETKYHGMDRDYDRARDVLESKLMEKSPGRLLDPYNPVLALPGYGAAGPLLFMCEKYTITEARERGGFCTVEMSFVEAGIPGNDYTAGGGQELPAMTVIRSSNMGSEAAGTALDQQQEQANSPSADTTAIEEMRKKLLEQGIPVM